MFPQPLKIMGYAPSESARYGPGLQQPARNPVWFGRTVIPLKPGDAVDLNRVFP